MKQLKMFWKRQKPSNVILLDDYSIRRFNGSDTDINHWLEVCKNGLVSDEATKQSFIETMVNHEDLDVSNIFFIVYNSVPIATITPIIHKKDNSGYVHMVSCKTEFRGIGIGTALINIAMNFIYDNGCDSAILTTDDFRVSAVKSYLTAGFVPVLSDDSDSDSDSDDNMEQRWIAMLNILKVPCADAVDDNGVFVKTLTI